MLAVFKKIQQFKSKWTSEQILVAAVLLVMGLIIIIALSALYRPISSRQYQAIQSLDHQQYYPQSQNIAAQLLLDSEGICMAQYLKLMHVYQYEAAKERQLEPIRIEE